MAGQLIRRGDNKWLLRVYEGRDAQGKREYYSKTFHGAKKEAQRELRTMLLRRDRGERLTPPKQTLDEYLDDWLATTAKPSVRARTFGDYEDTLKRYVRPHLGRVKLGAITPVDVRRMIAALSARGLASRTVRKSHEVLRNALEQAVADGFITANPARGRLVRKALPKKEKKERKTVPADRVQDFVEAAAADRLGAYWILLLTGGLRPSEALALRWDDFVGDAVRVQRVLVDRAGVDLKFAPPKSKESTRAVVLPRVTLDALREHRKRQVEERLKAGSAWQEHGLIFCDEVGRPLRQDKTRTHFRNVLKAAGLPPMRIYDLRHSAATLLLEWGEDLTTVKERLGHSTVTLTADLYKQARRGSQERAASKFDERVG